MASTPAFFENSTFLVKTTSFVNQILARGTSISRNGASVCAAAAADDVVQTDAGADAGGGLAVWAHAVEVVILVQGNEEKILAQDAAISGVANVIEILIGIAPGIDQGGGFDLRKIGGQSAVVGGLINCDVHFDGVKLAGCAGDSCFVESGEEFRGGQGDDDQNDAHDNEQLDQAEAAGAVARAAVTMIDGSRSR